MLLLLLLLIIWVDGKMGDFVNSNFLVYKNRSRYFLDPPPVASVL